MKKISSRDKKILFVLLLIIMCVVYYMFFYTKHQTSIQDLKSQKQTVDQEYEIIQAKLMSANDLDKKIEEKYARIIEIAEKNYGLIKQENHVLLIQNLARDTGIKINSINFVNELLTLSDTKRDVDDSVQKQQEIDEKAKIPKIDGLDLSDEYDYEDDEDDGDSGDDEDFGEDDFDDELDNDDGGDDTASASQISLIQQTPFRFSNLVATDDTDESADELEEETDADAEEPLAEGEEGELSEEDDVSPEPNEEGTDEETDGTEEGAESETDGSEDGTDGSEDGTDGSEDGTDGSEDGTDGTEDGTDASVDGADGSEDGTDGSEDGTDGSEDGTDGSEDGNDDQSGDGENVDDSAKQEGTQPDESELEKSYIDMLEAEIHFVGDYSVLDNFLDNVYNHPKNIIVRSVKFNSGIGDKDKSGTIKLAFYGVRDLVSFMQADEDLFPMRTSRGDLAYVPYDSFVIEGGGASDLDNNDDKYDPNDGNGGGGGGSKPDPNKPYDPNNPDNTVIYKKLLGFEKLDAFFVPEDNNSLGTLSLTSKARHGRRALKFTYNFSDPAAQNRGNVVFDKHKVMLYNRASTIVLSVAGAEKLGENKLGAYIVNSDGSKSVIYFTIVPDKYGWTTASSNMPEGVKYPCMIQRLFVEGNGTGQTTSGTLIFDDLRYVANLGAIEPSGGGSGDSSDKATDLDKITGKANPEASYMPKKITAARKPVDRTPRSFVKIKPRKVIITPEEQLQKSLGIKLDKSVKEQVKKNAVEKLKKSKSEKGKKRKVKKVKKKKGTKKGTKKGLLKDSNKKKSKSKSRVKNKKKDKKTKKSLKPRTIKDKKKKSKKPRKTHKKFKLKDNSKDKKNNKNKKKKRLINNEV